MKPTVPHNPTRRALLAGSGLVFAWAQMPRPARADGRDPRLLVIVLRGALDGLALAAPVGDPQWRDVRAADALTLDGTAPGLRLDGLFALNPAMPTLHEFYRHAHATIVHAVATPYRDRSHFDGQDVLQTGMTKPLARDAGWLNHAVASLARPASGDARTAQALAIGPVTPLVMRGPAPVLAWQPARLPPAADGTVLRLLDLYRHTDPLFARALEERLGTTAIARAGGIDQAPPSSAKPVPQPRGIAAQRAYFVEAAGTAAKFLARPDGPRVGALGFDGWDTHVNEGPVNGRLANLLGALDDALAAIAANAGESWRDTIVAVITEFGRTAHINGSGGTDHGTATVALLVGGAVTGGRVVADWPGLKVGDLLDGRDLKPTADLRAVLKGVLRDHLRVARTALDNDVFPGSAGVPAMPGLVA